MVCAYALSAPLWGRTELTANAVKSPAATKVMATVPNSALRATERIMMGISYSRNVPDTRPVSNCRTIAIH